MSRRTAGRGNRDGKMMDGIRQDLFGLRLVLHPSPADAYLTLSKGTIPNMPGFKKHTFCNV
jgi:hypothetical protein